jgi:hypothetical protein
VGELSAGCASPSSSNSCRSVASEIPPVPGQWPTAPDPTPQLSVHDASPCIDTVLGRDQGLQPASVLERCSVVAGLLLGGIAGRACPTTAAPVYPASIPLAPAAWSAPSSDRRRSSGRSVLATSRLHMTAPLRRSAGGARGAASIRRVDAAPGSRGSRVWCIWDWRGTATTGIDCRSRGDSRR